MVKRMLFLFILVFACFSQTNLNNDLDGNPISFHGIIPDKTTYSEAYDHLKYVVGLENLSVKEYADGFKYLEGTEILEIMPKMGRIYKIDFNVDDQKNPTVESIRTRSAFLQDDLIHNLEAMAQLFPFMEDEMIAQYGEPSKAPPDQYLRGWKFSSDIYESNYHLKIRTVKNVVFLVRMFDGKYK